VARRICNSTDEGDTFHASLYERDAFASFDLSVLTRKQLDVIAMRYCGMLSWRRIAAFEGVTHRAVRKRHALALSKLRAQIPCSISPAGHTDNGGNAHANPPLEPT